VCLHDAVRSAIVFGPIAIDDGAGNIRRHKRNDFGFQFVNLGRPFVSIGYDLIGRQGEASFDLCWYAQAGVRNRNQER
jgi:hypothetical protein